METKRLRLADLECKPVKPYQVKTAARRATIRALASEYLHGNSQSRLYVSMLVRAMVHQDPGLCWQHYESLQRCGIPQAEVDKWVSEFWAPSEVS